MKHSCTPFLRSLALLIPLSLLSAVGAHAQLVAVDETGAVQLRGADHDPSVPAPEAVLGHALGERPASVDALVAYARLLAQSSDRVRLEETGFSVEGDPLLLLIISSAANHARLAGRRERLERILDPWLHDESQRRAAWEQTLPATWIGASVHGDEASGVDAVLALAHHLAADRNPETLEILEASVVLIDPCQNPDGRRRFLNHLRSFTRRPRPDDFAQAVEHTQLWPGGRRNHYFFDLNRDWAFLTQPETRARVGAFLRWRPQVFVDLHEMGSQATYFFPPPTDPVNPHLPESLLPWWDRFGRANAEAFDREGLSYYVREDFDLFYPGYGDSWPSHMGALGMTYEQATSRGLAIIGAGDDTRRYGDAVRGHLVAALTTCRVAASNADALMADFGRYYEIVRQHADDDPAVEIVIDAAQHRAEAHRLASLLVTHGARVERTSEPFSARGRRVGQKQTENHEFSAGSYRIPLRQSVYPLLRSLLDPDTPLDEGFLVQELSRRDLGLRARFYDVTAWSLTLTHDLAAYALRRSPSVPSRTLFAGEPLAGEITRTGNGDPVAWIIPYEDDSTMRALARLFEDEIDVWVAREAFRQGEQRYPRGSLIVRAHVPHDDELPQALALVARDTGARVIASDSAWSDEGPSLGSNQVVRLRAPRVVLATGPGVDPGSVGAVQWLLEEHIGWEYSAVVLSQLARVSLREIDSIVLPDLTDDADVPLKELHAWVQSGGCLIAIGGAATQLIESEFEWTSARLVEDLAELEAGAESASAVSTDDDEPPPSGRSASRSVADPPASVPRERQPERVPGAIARVTVDEHHFLSFGGGATAFAPVLSDRIILPSDEGRNVVLYANEGLRVAGFMWPSMELALGGAAYVVDEEHGKGRLILFAEDPAFRGFWPSTSRWLLNAIVFGPQLPR